MLGDAKSLRFEAFVTKGCVRLQHAFQIATYLWEEAVLSCGHVKYHPSTFADSFSLLVADGMLTPNDQVPANLTAEANFESTQLCADSRTEPEGGPGAVLGSPFLNLISSRKSLLADGVLTPEDQVFANLTSEERQHLGEHATRLQAVWRGRSTRTSIRLGSGNTPQTVSGQM
jgi:hypothetical protein